LGQRKISELFEDKPRTLSFEFYPPKTDKGEANLLRTAESLAELGADFFSVTYGAGGSGSRKTLDVVEQLLERVDQPIMHHLTCVKHTFDDIRYELETLKRAGVRNIMALRGDPPTDEEYVAAPNKPHYGFELVKIIREWEDWFCIGVPGFPEIHPLAVNADLDSAVLRVKQESGAEFVVTQLFFDNRLFFEYLGRIRSAGINLRVIPGVLPITNYRRVVDFCQMCGSSVPEVVHEAFAPIEDDPEAVAARGIEFAVRQVRGLLDAGAPGVHFYCLNKLEPVASIVREVGL
jgi:methylenetetrahydrofolate reductase (NADPH)